MVDEARGYCTGRDCTVFLFAHSRTLTTGQTAEGNAWQHLSAGDHVTFTGSTYTVTDRLVVEKGDLAAAPIWEHAADRLVLTTCDESNVDANIIVILKRARS